MSLASGTGLTSGIDYNTMLTKLRQVNSQPITLIQRQASKLNSQHSSLQNINKALLDFKTKADALSTSSTFLNMLASSTDQSVVSASADNTATAGNYSVKVLQLAQAGRLASQGVATTDSTSIANGAGTFKFSVGTGGTEISVGVTAGMTLSQLRDSINSATGTKVRASIVNDGSQTNPYRLVLTSTDTGTANAITIVNNDTTVNLATNTIEAAAARTSNTFNGTVTSAGTYTGTTSKKIMMEITTAGDVGTAKYRVSSDGGLTWGAKDAMTTSATNQDVTGTANEGVNVNFGAGTAAFAVGDRFSVDTFVPELQKAQDGVIEVDGVQVSRANNTYSDVIGGVTLTANKVDTDANSVKVVNNNGAVQSNIKLLASSYNALVDAVAKETAYNSDTKTSAPLGGDASVSSLLADIRGIVSGMVPGLGDISTLSSIGVTMDKDGHLAVDATKLSTAMTKNLEGVKSLFIEAGTSTSSEIQFSKSTSDTKIGSYKVNITTVAQQATVGGGRALETTGLASDERLTIGYKDTAQSIMLTAGQKIDSIVTSLNAMFTDKGMTIQASNDQGKLKINSTAYGSEEKISVSSNKDAAAVGQLGVGTTAQESKGVDVAGTINGFLATGSGQNLTASAASDAKGLQLLITAKAPSSSTVNLTHGIALNASNRITLLTDSTTGLFAVRDASYATQMKDYQARIDDLNTRLDAEDKAMRAKFNGLEAKLAEMQSQGNFLMSQLSSMISTR